MAVLTAQLEIMGNGMREHEDDIQHRATGQTQTLVC